MIATQWGEPSEMQYAEVADPTPGHVRRAARGTKQSVEKTYQFRSRII